jgi:hypothetical protein
MSAAITAELKARRESAERRLRDLRAVLDRNPDEARAVMQALFEGRLRFTLTEEADGRRYGVRGTASIRSGLDSPMTHQRKSQRAPQWRVSGRAEQCRDDPSGEEPESSASPAGLVPLVSHPALRFDSGPVVWTFSLELSA